MFRNTFYDRTKELKQLKELENSEKFKCILLTGRRRIGKSYLVRKFAMSKNSIVVQFERTRKNLDKLSEAVRRHYSLPSLAFTSYKDVFEFIIKMEKKKIIVVLDEITYLFEDKEVLGEFQSIIDELNYQNINMLLILTGSYYSILKRGVLERSAPLYGRFDAIIKLKGFSYADILKYYSKNEREAFILWAVTGGVPKYLNILKEGDIENALFGETSFLLYEGKQLLEEELRAVDVYSTILEGISKGYATISEIGSYAGLKPKDTSKYVNVLRELGYVKKFYRKFSKTKKSSFYLIIDNFMNLWYRFINPYFEEISSGYAKEAKQNFKINFNKYLGNRFELFAYNYFAERYEQVFLNLQLDKESEIDLAISTKKDLMFIEVKWKTITLKKAKHIMKRLEEKTASYPQASLGLFARDINERAREWLVSNGYKVWDLGDVKKKGED